MSENTVECPRCHSAEISRSRKRRLVDFAMRLVGLKPFRCMECRKRFYLADVYEGQIKHRQRWKRTSRKRSSSEAA